MESEYFSFEKFKQGNLRNMSFKREGEMKMGFTLSNLEDAKYVIIGVEESFGPRANHGKGGAENGFSAFLSTFLNMQATESLAGDEIHLLGKVVVLKENDDVLEMRSIVRQLDEFIYQLLVENIKEGQIPILIGGGHNNAYPLMKFSSERYNKSLQVINLDAHADYRILEGRHSGNSFSYAFQSGLIKKYSVLGLHQRYNSQQIINELNRDGHYYSFHEDYIFGNRNYDQDFVNLYELFSESKDYIGVELDMDTIERMPSSAFSPVGIPIELARVYLNRMGRIDNIAYLHLPEGAPMNDKEDKIIGKTLAYLVTDFIMAHG